MEQLVRELLYSEVELMMDYFFSADDDFLIGMGADPKKLPSREDWLERLKTDFSKDKKDKGFYYLGWEYKGKLVGHSNINNINYAKEACAHLHLWDKDLRQSGLGRFFFQESIHRFFAEFPLKRIICEPYAKNPAPNKTLAKLGFEFEKSYVTVPGLINFEQEVNRWQVTREQFSIQNSSFQS